MIKHFSSFLLVLAMLIPAVGIAGQHSGLGGTPPPAPIPTPVPEQSMFATVEEYLSTYYEWLREQAEHAGEQQNAVSNPK